MNHRRALGAFGRAAMSSICQLPRSIIKFLYNFGRCPAFLLNIEKRSLPRLMLSGDGLASNGAM